MVTEKIEELGEENKEDANEFSQFISYQKHAYHISLAQHIYRERLQCICKLKEKNLVPLN